MQKIRILNERNESRQLNIDRTFGSDFGQKRIKNFDEWNLFDMPLSKKNSYRQVFHFTIGPNPKDRTRFDWVQIKIKLKRVRLDRHTKTGFIEYRNTTEATENETFRTSETSRHEFLYFLYRNFASRSLARSDSNISSREHIHLFLCFAVTRMRNIYLFMRLAWTLHIVGCHSARNTYLFRFHLLCIEREQ